MLITLSIVTVALLVVTLLPLSRNPHWLVRSADFPRLQCAVLATLVLLSAAITLDYSSPATWFIVSAASACLLWQAWWIVPYTRFWTIEVDAAARDEVSRQISILTSNVLTSNKNADALLTLVAKYKPDVLVTLESDQWWQDQLDTLDAEMPHSMKYPLDNLYGMHVYSKLPLDQTSIEFLVEDDVPSMHALVKLRNEQWVRMHFLHPAPPSPTENEESSERDAELLMVARSISGNDRPTIVTGDLNDVAWSSTTRLFCKLSGLLDPRVGRGMFNTFHAAMFFLRWPLDHVFHSAHFRLLTMQRLPSIGSDHFPLFTCLSFEPEKASEVQQSPSADQLDYERSSKILREQEVSAADVPQPGH